MGSKTAEARGIRGACGRDGPAFRSRTPKAARAGSESGLGRGGRRNGYALAGLVLLFAVGCLTDWPLLPSVTIRQEVVGQEVPNVGVGYLEALFNLGTSVLIGWTL